MTAIFRHAGRGIVAGFDRLRLFGRILKGPPPREVTPEALTFQSDIEQIIHSPPPPYMRSTVYVLFTLFVSLLLIASLVDIDAVVSAPGRLTTDAPPIVMQPIERAIIRQLNVKAGDIVTKGQVMATLDSTFAQADMTSLSAQNRLLLAQLRRLDAERNGTPFVPSGVVSPEEELQATLYRQRQAQYASRVRSFDEDIRRLQSSIHSAEDQSGSLAKTVVVAKEVESMRSSLFQSQNGSKLNYLDAQATRMRAERDLQDADNRATELQHTVQAKQAERQAFIDDWRRQLLEDLVRTQTEATKLDEGLAKASLVENLVSLTAPADGVVVEVAKRSVGSIMHEGEPLFTLVSSDAPLIAEVMISSGDVGAIRTGDEVLVKVDAFPYLRHGALEGRLRSIGEELIDMSGAPTQGHSGGGAFHRGQVELLKTQLDKMPDGARLIPGMTATAEIKVGRRSVISYFLSPLRKTLSEGLNQR